MYLIKLFTSFHGRIGRLAFWFGLIVLMVAGSSLGIAAYPNILSDDPFNGVLKNWKQMGTYGLLISIGLLYPAMALVIKRLHDRDKSGWRAALFWAPALIQAVASLTGMNLDKAYNLTTWIAGYLIAVGIWFIIELGFYGGTKGNNIYGPKPGNKQTISN